MADIVRHIGSLKATGSRIIVVFREIPDDVNRCLIIQSDSLPESFRDAVSHVVNHSGQNTKDLYEALHRERMPNGENMLGALHKYNLLRPVATSEILMHPTRDYAVPLNELNDQLRIIADETTTTNEADIQKKFNPYQEKAEKLDAADAINISAKLMLEADALELEVSRKRERAYKLRPELKETFANLSGNKDIDLNLLSDDHAMQIVNEFVYERGFKLVSAFDIITDEDLAKTTTDMKTFSIELEGISQTKAIAALKQAWATLNKK